MHNFEYLNPTDLSELPELLAGKPQENVIIAGGTDLLDRLKERLIRPERVVNIKNIDALHGIEYGKELRIGALTRIADIAHDERIGNEFPVLAEAAAAIATPQLRNMGTIGGNLTQRPRCWYFRGEEYRCLKKGGRKCFAVDGLNKYHAIFGGGPCYITHPSDSAPALIALGASIEVLGGKGSRIIPLEDFFVLPSQDVRNENILQPDELIVRIIIPKPGANSRSTYYKFREKQSLDFAVSSVAVLLEMGGRKVDKARIVLGGVAPIPWRVKSAEAALTGKPLSEESISKAAEASVAGSDPLPQNGYKVILTRNIVRRTLTGMMAG